MHFTSSSFLWQNQNPCSVHKSNIEKMLYLQALCAEKQRENLRRSAESPTLFCTIERNSRTAERRLQKKRRKIGGSTQHLERKREGSIWSCSIYQHHCLKESKPDCRAATSVENVYLASCMSSVRRSGCIPLNPTQKAFYPPRTSAEKTEHVLEECSWKRQGSGWQAGKYDRQKMQNSFLRNPSRLEDPTVFLCYVHRFHSTRSWFPGQAPKQIRTRSEPENRQRCRENQCNLVIRYREKEKEKQKRRLIFKRKGKLGWLIWYFWKLVKLPEICND
ncbi:Hypothetical predicted protein [Podarcis lilfordi]|uniref:Uncharacterized protein n=1 Tax=Podarcis lilfordi TaxID=74358 RepID=A0AA35K188_9SAUR|nr:Hypothetical predicted protein [Podarcis lilfordi]